MSDAGLAKKYSVALQDYLSEPDEDLLLTAYELGRAALGDGLGVLEIATVHSRSLASVLQRPLTDAERSRVLDRQTDFFVEVLSAFEMTHRGFRDANTVLRRLNDVLEGQAKRIAYTLHDEASQSQSAIIHDKGIAKYLIEVPRYFGKRQRTRIPRVLADLGI